MSFRALGLRFVFWCNGVFSPQNRDKKGLH